MNLLLRVLILFLCAEKFKIHSEVVPNFNTCKNFFYKSGPPVITFTAAVELDPAYICQTLGNVHRFATLYSKYWKIPMYSAYELLEPETSKVGPNGEIQVVKECAGEQKIRGTWFIEPQLSPDRVRPPDMTTAGRETDSFKKVQAIEVDYVNTGFDRGHLNPASYNCDKAREATFTLTNAIPQNPCFNEQTWKIMEQTARTAMRELCNFPGAKRYFVTGSVPQNRMIPNREHDAESDRTREFNRVSVPSHLWTAACCDSSTATDATKRTTNGFSFAYYGENKAYSCPTSGAVSDLEAWLTRTYKPEIKTIKIFADDCYKSSANSKSAAKMLQKVIGVQESNAAAGVGSMKPCTVPPKKRP